MGSGWNHHLRDGHRGDGPDARVGGGRRANCAHEVGSRARRSRSCVARVPARRSRRSCLQLLRQTATSRTLRSLCWICRRARGKCRSAAAVTPTCTDGASGLRLRRDVARRRIRPSTVGGGRDAYAGARGCGDDRRSAADVAMAANGALVYIRGVAGSGAERTVMLVDRQGRASPLPGLPPARTVTFACRRTAPGSHSPRRRTCGPTVLPARR